MSRSEEGHRLLLVAAAAGAPFAIKLTQLSGGTVPYTSGLIVLLVVVSIGYMPLVVPPLAGTTVGTWTIAKPLVLTMLLPLGVGLTVDALWPRVAHRLAPGLVRLARNAGAWRAAHHRRSRQSEALGCGGGP